VIIPSARRGLPVALAGVAGVIGTLVALHYHQLDLTLSHYDARGHLIVARRIIDSITPGWQQIGAVWLPLPHLLNLLPVQVDAWYQSGASAVAISIAAFAVAVGAIASIVLQLTGSPWAAVAGAAVFALNPNVLYLQATPMTEPLLFGFTTLAVAMLLAWSTVTPADRESGVARSGSRSASRIGWMLALACLTRYEAWPITAAALAAAWWARWRQGEAPARAARSIAAIAAFPIIAILGFVIFSRVVIGQWFVASGFFVPENDALGHPITAAAEIWYGLRSMSGPIVLAIGAAGWLAALCLGLTRVRWSPALIAVSLAASAALPWLAFFDGHPFRIRYMTPLIAVEGVGVGVALALACQALGAYRRLAPLIVVAVLGVIGYEMRPLDLQAPMVVEAQWDRPNVPVRARVTACLGAPQPGQKIMASMGSLGHYMQETSRSGFYLRDFLHEGNGDIWLAAIAEGPRLFAEWVLIEEKAEGGDMLAALARQRPHFLDGYSRVCEGAGIALYKRRDAPTEITETSGRTP
jgi:hypothetical protein